MIMSDNSAGQFGHLRVIRGGDKAEPQDEQKKPEDHKTPPRAPLEPNPVVLAVQRRLQALGHFNGTAHGLFDAATLEGIKSYKRSSGLPVTGEITPMMLGDLGIDSVATQAKTNQKTMTTSPPTTKIPPVFFILGLAGAAVAVMYVLDRRHKTAITDGYDDVNDLEEFDDDSEYEFEYDGEQEKAMDAEVIAEADEDE